MSSRILKVIVFNKMDHIPDTAERTNYRGMDLVKESKKGCEGIQRLVSLKNH